MLVSSATRIAGILPKRCLELDIRGLWGRAKLTIRNLIKKFEKDELFGVYIAIFESKNLNIGCISAFF